MGFISQHIRKIAIASLLTVIIVLSYIAFINAGKTLVKEDEIAEADIILLLMGSVPDRTLHSIDLYLQGSANEILAIDNFFVGQDLLEARGASFPTNAELCRMIAFELGVAHDDFIILDGPAYSTIDEAVFLREYLRDEEDAETIILVTSKYHSYRTSLIFSKALASLDRDIKIISSPSQYDSFEAEKYWQHRESMKSVFMEYCKIAYFILWEQFKL